MKKYAFLAIHYAGGVTQKGVNLYCTDHHTMDWIFDELIEKIPGMKGRFVRKGLDGTINFVQMYKLGGKDYEIAHWIFRRACEVGWEPRDMTTPEHKVFHRFDEVTFKLRRTGEASSE